MWEICTFEIYTFQEFAPISFFNFWKEHIILGLLERKLKFNASQNHALSKAVYSSPCILQCFLVQMSCYLVSFILYPDTRYPVIQISGISRSCPGILLSADPCPHWQGPRQEKHEEWALCHHHCHHHWHCHYSLFLASMCSPIHHQIYIILEL